MVASDLSLACAERSCSWLWDRVATAASLCGWLWEASWQQELSCMPGIGGKPLASESLQLQSEVGRLLPMRFLPPLVPSVLCHCRLLITYFGQHAGCLRRQRVTL